MKFGYPTSRLVSRFEEAVQIMIWMEPNSLQGIDALAPALEIARG